MAIPAPSTAPYVGAVSELEAPPGKAAAFPRRGDEVRAEALRLLAGAGRPVPGGVLAEALQVDLADLPDLLAYLVATERARHWSDGATSWWAKHQPRLTGEPDKAPFTHRVVHVTEPSTIWMASIWSPECAPSN